MSNISVCVDCGEKFNNSEILNHKYCRECSGFLCRICWVEDLKLCLNCVQINNARKIIEFDEND